VAAQPRRHVAGATKKETPKAARINLRTGSRLLTINHAKSNILQSKVRYCDVA